MKMLVLRRSSYPRKSSTHRMSLGYQPFYKMHRLENSSKRTMLRGMMTELSELSIQAKSRFSSIRVHRSK